MTSELKLCEWCGSATPCSDGACPLKRNTRAMPDVPELVRYEYERSSHSFFSQETGERASDGEYVLHSEAAKIIAAKDGQITDYKNLVDVLHAELAQYEAQVPVAWRHPEAGWTDVSKAEVAVHCKHGTQPQPLYASPAPAEDLKEKSSHD